MGMYNKNESPSRQLAVKDRGFLSFSFFPLLKTKKGKIKKTALHFSVLVPRVLVLILL